MYYIIVNCILGQKLKKNRDYLYSFRYLTSNRKGLFFRAVNVFGKKGRVFMYGVLNWIYCMLTLLPTVVWVEWEIAAVVFGCLIIAIATWNGGNFYVEVFSRGTYEKAVEHKEKKEKKENAKENQKIN